MWPQVLFQEERRTLQNDGSDCRQIFGIFLLIPHMAASATPQQWTLGIVFIVLVAAIWAAASVATQFIYTNLCFDQPFVLTYVCTSLFALYLPGWGALSAIGAVKNPPLRSESDCDPSDVDDCWDRKYEKVALKSDRASSCSSRDCQNDGITSDEAVIRAPLHDPACCTENDINVFRYQGGYGVSSDEEEEKEKIESTTLERSGRRERLSHYGTARVSLIVCPLWFLANWTYYMSLAMTSVTSSTIIATTSTLFSFILSVIFIGENFTLFKLLGVVFCMIGTILVTLDDQSADDDDDDGGGSSDVSRLLSGADCDDDGSTVTGGVGEHVAGDIVALFSAVMYSCYTVVIRKCVPDDDTVAMPLMFGYLGLFNAVLIAPVLILMALVFSRGMFHNFNGEVFGLISALGIVNNVLSDYLWARAVILTTPTIATVGLSLTIPLAFVSDGLFNHIAPSLLSGFGAVMVVFGFVLVNVGDVSGDGCAQRCSHLSAVCSVPFVQCKRSIAGLCRFCFF